MAREALTGSRIRERRVMGGLKQADLAKAIGISASYLNLIEHNRRRIGGKLLLNIAETLGVEANLLTEGAEATLISAMREAADEAGLSGPEAARADEFAGRFPGWADVLVGTRRRVAALEQTVEALSDRLSHDPHLAASMHELLSTAAAVRSTAAILAETKTLQAEWRERFHANIHEDSRRLSDSAEALVAYFDAEADAADAAGSPQEEVEAFLSAYNFSFGALETPNEETLRDVVTSIVTAHRPVLSQTAQHIAQGVLVQVARDASALQLEALRSAIAEIGPEPLELAARFGVATSLVLRRMAALQELGAGLVVCDRSGTVLFRKSVEGFTVPRHGACCPLWPLFGALGQPGLVARQTISQLGRSQARFVAFATSEISTPATYNAPTLSQAVMLLLPETAMSENDLAVGSTCRVCPQTTCSARRELSILAGTA
jgi:predicted transcriptional regulator/DNA-binding XRE family transcriptional regulator